MRVKIKENLWTDFSWWTQLLINKNRIIVRNIGPDEEIQAELTIAENKNKEQLKELLEYLHMAAVNEDKSFNVENWTKRYKEQK